MRLLLALVFLSLSANALEYGCDLHPSELNELATRTADTFRKQKQAFPDTLLIKAEFEGTLGVPSANIDKPMYGTVEGFYRPLEDAYYSVIPIPVLGVALSRSRNVLYSCGHFDSDPAKTHLTVYMMRGGKLDPASWTNFLGQITLSDKLEVQPLSASLIGINEIRNRFLFFLQWIPIFDLGYQITDRLQSLLANTLGDFTGVGVERITLTMDYVEIASGVDLNNPRNARLIRKIRFKRDGGGLEPDAP